MEIVSWIVYGIAVFVAISWVFGIRHDTNTGQGVSMLTVNTTLLFLVSLALIPILEINPFNVIWMYIASIILGKLSLVFPFSLLSIFGNILASIACIGLDRDAITKRQARIRNMQELMTLEGLTTEQAKEKLIERGEW